MIMESKDSFSMSKKEQPSDASSVSPAVIRRLPRYHRYLKKLLSSGVMRISSGELSKIMNVTASQIRQDLNCFGGFGQQGYGYNVKYLDSKISQLLGVERGRCAILLGAGNFGRALAGSSVFEKSGVTLLGLFDINPALIGTTIAGLSIYSAKDLKGFCEENPVDIAVLTLPQPEAQKAAKALAKMGISGIWNLTDEELLTPGIAVENVHLSDSLLTLMYQIGADKR